MEAEPAESVGELGVPAGGGGLRFGEGGLI